MINKQLPYSANSLYKGNASGSFIAGKRPQEKCGVFGIYNYHGPDNASQMAFYALLALQHRGQESAGIAYNEDHSVYCQKGMGLVDHLFSAEEMARNSSTQAIGHVRYSTTGSSDEANAQPLIAQSRDQSSIALAHNGNLTNTNKLSKMLLDEGQIFHTTSDTELILTLMYRYRQQGLVEAAKRTMALIKGAYAVVAMNAQEMVAFRDPNGFRPLVMGNLGKATVFASETTALDGLGASFKCDIQPGEIIYAGPCGITTETSLMGSNHSLCIFEYIYFARPDSIVDGKSVHLIRKKIGSLLAARVPKGLDAVIPSPDSGVSAAIGLAQKLGIAFDWGIYRNPQLGRTFIKPSQDERELAVRLKLSPVNSAIKGKKVIIVDDSLVRGTTATVLAKMMKSAGAKEIHLCIASPPYIHPCYYGIDLPVAGELALMKNSLVDLSEILGVDSITFAEPRDLYEALEIEPTNLCTACFSGEYPVV